MIDSAALLTVLLLASAAGEAATPLSETEARARVVAFLTRGVAPPRRLLTRTAERRAKATLDHDSVHGPCFTFRFTRRKQLRWVVRLERSTGRVVALRQPDRGLIVAVRSRDSSPRPHAERAEEIARRSRPRVELTRRAREYLLQLYPALDRRRFVLTREELVTRGERVTRRYVFEERRTPGVRALFVNRATLELDPEAATLVGADVTQLSYEVRRAPPITSAAARTAARRLLRLVPGQKARCALRVVLTGPRLVRPAWVVTVGDRRVRIDAHTGRRLRFGPL